MKPLTLLDKLSLELFEGRAVHLMLVARWHAARQPTELVVRRGEFEALECELGPSERWARRAEPLPNMLLPLPDAPIDRWPLLRYLDSPPTK